MFNYLNSKENKGGFTLLEVMTAVFVVTVGLIGVFIVIQNLSTYTAYSKDRLVASYLAQEGMEIIRNIRDTNWLEPEIEPENPNPWDEDIWDGGLSACSSGCEVDYTTSTFLNLDLSYSNQYLKIDSNGFYSYNPGTETKFKRKIIISAPGTSDCPVNNCLLVKVSVSWSKGKVETLGKLYNWQMQ